MQFEFATAVRVIFGVGVAARLASLAAEFGARPLLVTGKQLARAQPSIDLLTAAGLTVSPWSVAGEPSTLDVEAGLEFARTRACDLVIAIGGGSAIDTGKAIAALLTNDGPPLDYLEVVGRGRALVHPPAPFIAVPTTAGTGSEVTRNAVLAALDQRVKVSLRSPAMLPRVALVDPALTLTLPPKITADCGLDALTQCLEPLVCNKPNPITDALARDGLTRAVRSLRRAFTHGHDLDARTDMALASLLGGMALANAALGAVHGFAGPIGGLFPAPHGAVCARLLPEVITANVAALRARAPGGPALPRYHELARLLCGHPHATIDDAITWLRTLAHDLEILPLAEYGVTLADLPDLVARSQRASSMRGNPIELTAEELHTALAAAL